MGRGLIDEGGSLGVRKLNINSGKGGKKKGGGQLEAGIELVTIGASG